MISLGPLLDFSFLHSHRRLRVPWNSRCVASEGAARVVNRWVLAPGVWEEKAELFLCVHRYTWALGPPRSRGTKGQKGNMGKNHFSVHLFPHSFIQ